MDKLISTEFVERRKSCIEGFGLFCLKDFKRGDIVCSYDGYFISDDEMNSLLDEKNELAFYALDYGSCHIIPHDITAVGGHMANHSCKPNCWYYPQGDGMGLIANSDISCGSEITVSYGTYIDDTICSCGENFCTGRISFFTKGSRNQSIIDQNIMKKFIEVSFHNYNLVMIADVVGSLSRQAMASCQDETAYLANYLRKLYGQNLSGNQYAKWAYYLLDEVKKPKNDFYRRFVEKMGSLYIT